MKKKSIATTLAVAITLSGLLLLSYHRVYSERKDALHPKLIRGGTPNACYCTGINDCEAAASGMVYCGNFMSCSDGNASCTISG